MATGTVFPTHHRGAPWMRLFLALLLALGALAVRFPAQVGAANVAVTNTNDSGNGSLRKAILDTETTAGADTILFSLPGSGPWTITLASPLPTITRPLTIIGPGQNQLTIQGNNTFRLLVINAPGQEIDISGLTLTNGKAVGSYGGNLRSVGGNLTLADVALTNGTADEDQGGAGAFLTNGSYTLSGVFVSGNVARGTNTHGSGAGLNVSEYHGDVSVAISNSIIADNESTWFRGGGLMMSRASGVAGRTLSVTLTNSVVNDNTVEPNPGGGIYNDRGTLTLTDSLVSGNGTSGGGGGIYNNQGTVTLNGSIIAENTNSILHGGGLYNDKGTMTLNNGTVSGNKTAHSGGGLYNNQGTVTLVGSTVSGNDATYGAGIYNSQGTVTLLNVTVSGNTAAYGGGLANTQGTLTLVFATVVGNTATTEGGGIETSGYNGIAATTTLGRSIVVGNFGPSDADCSTYDPAVGPTTSAGYNVVGDGTGCPANGSGDFAPDTPAAVLKAVLADNGGLTKTHALVYGSPAINRVPCINTIDQRGVARPFGGNCDSGAFEFLPIASVALTLTTSGGNVGRSPAGTGSGPFNYTPTTVVTLTPQPTAGKVFVGWKVDGVYRGWANPLTIAMNADFTVEALFAPATLFPDVPAGRADAAAIAALATRGAIRGYQNGNFGPDDGVTRAQMAALIARAMPAVSPTDLTPPACLVAGTWDCQEYATFFTDREGVDGNLWRNIGILAYYEVVKGYGPEACAAKGKDAPCFGPNDSVSFAQTISFITRAMVKQGYWQAQPNAPYPYAGVPGPHAADVATFYYYTGGIPAAPADWNGGAARGWFAQALWAALNSYWGLDGLLPDGKSAGGYVP